MTQERLHLNLLCKKHREGYTVMVGPGWIHPRLLPFFDDHFETARIFLDFEHLERSLKKLGAECVIKESKYGSKELNAEGEAAQVVAKWLNSAMASAIVDR